MDNIDDLILYENENIRLDFKLIEYRKENYSSLLKDVLSMANADTTENRYIVIGLKPENSSERGFKGIDDITDAATIQQIVHENIEPEIEIEYYSYRFKEFNFGVIKITNCTNPPYLMKKDYGNNRNQLKKGDGYIRKGTHQTKLTRKDYERFTELRINESFFNSDIEFTLESQVGKNKIFLINSENIILPSEVEKDKIERILKEKKENPFPIIAQLQLNMSIVTGYTPYEYRDIPTLEHNLENVQETYYEEDCYELLEKNANRINILINNKGHKYIEDASIRLKIPKIEGLFVAEKIYNKPSSKSKINYNGTSNLFYPTVTNDNQFYYIETNIGDIKHQIIQDAFKIEVRLIAKSYIELEAINIECELFAKNIKTSIKKSIDINIVPHEK